ncbi:MAG TPA: thymidylate synthase [Pyrinomonadaceae bacterium]|nr:thymidylate synthase [Pyrinomonadaceae bacterium]
MNRRVYGYYTKPLLGSTFNRCFVWDKGRTTHRLYSENYLGVPFNISSYALLTHLVAHVCGLQVGEFIYTLGDYHIYQNHLEQVSEVLSREPFPLPRLEIRDDDPQVHSLAGLLSMRFEHLNLAGYESHAKIAASVAV